MNNQRPGPGQTQNKQQRHPNQQAPRRDGAPQAPGHAPGQSQGVRPPNPNRHRRPPRRGDNRFLNNRSRNPQVAPQGQQNPNNPNRGLTGDKIFRRYEYLQDQHCIARRKYFENYYKTEGSQRERTEKNFYSTLEQLRDYVSTLTPEQKEIFEKKYNGNPMDLDYSQSHGLPAQPERVRFADKFEDPHTLKSQLEADFSTDTEESVGTIEDYNQYKGIA